MDNPISNLIDDPNNPFERAKKFATEKVSEVLQSETGQNIMQKVEAPMGVLAKAAIPYRDYAAPAITSILLEMNSEYRKQNPNLSIWEQLNRAQELSKVEVPGEESWRRAISPGRALVGLIGNWNFAGDQGVDKLDWSNAYAVNKYFTSGSAQFWSGLADLGFNILDPVAFAGGKTVKFTRNEFITRPVTGGRHGTGRIDKVIEEIDAAVANPEKKTGASALFELLEKNPDNIRGIRGYGMVAGSANSQRLAVALSNAQKAGGRDAVSTVLKATLGHKDSITKLKNEYESIHTTVMRNTGMNEVQREELSAVSATRDSLGKATPEQLDKITAEEAEYISSIEKIEKENEALLARSEEIQSVLQEDFAISTTFSKSHAIERTRAALAEAGAGGMYIDVDPKKHFRLAKLAAKSANVKPLTARTIMWLSPNQQLRETPAGLAFLGGAAGEAAWKEYDARIAEMGRIGGMTKDEMEQLSNQFGRLTNKSERFNAFENLGMRSFELLVKKYYAKDFDTMLPAQQEAVRAFVTQLYHATTRAKSREVDSILQKNYTFMHHSEGNAIANSTLDSIVEDVAGEIAAKRGATKATEIDRTMAKASLRQTPITETQVPDYHFGMDMKFLDQIMSENPRMLRHMVDGIIENGWDAEFVTKKMRDAETASIEAGKTMGIGYDMNVAPWLRAAGDVVSAGIDDFYNYIWKPATLLSFKYTTRNVFEGWLRIGMSMVDFHSNFGYSYTSMVKGLGESGSITRAFTNRGIRRRSKAAAAKYDEKLAELQDAEGLLRKQTGMPSRRATPVAVRAKDGVISEADKKLLNENDGMTMLTQFIYLATDPLKSYTKTGNAAADTARDFIMKKANPVIHGKKGPYDEYEKEVMHLLAEGDFNTFHGVITKMDPESAIRMLGKYRDGVSEIATEMATHSADGSSTVGHALENSQYAIDRLLLHTERTMALIAERGKFLGELAELSGQISAKGKVRKAFESNKVELVPGVYIDAAFGGEAGDMLRRGTSSKATTTRTLANEVNVTGHGLLSVGATTKPVSPTNALWPSAHADYVNNVLMKDAVFNHMVRAKADGLSDADAYNAALKFARSSDTEAAAWRSETKQNLKTHSQNLGIDFDIKRSVDVLMLQMQQYLPPIRAVDGIPYQNMYDNALRGMTVEDSAKIEYADRLEVTAQLDLHERKLGTLYKNGVSRVFHYIGTLPEDHLVRHPFFNMIHDNEANRLVKKYVREAERLSNGDPEFVTKYLEANKDRIKSGAVNRAYKETMQRLYTVERHTLPSKFLRWVTPFYMAHQNSSRFWLGASLRNPEVAYLLSKAYNAPYRAGWVYDEQGNVVSEGEPWSIESNKQKIILNAKWLRDFTGKDSLVMAPSGIDVITQGQYPILPTIGGPIGEVFGREALKLAAKKTLPGTGGKGLDAWLQDTLGYTLDEFSGKYFMPYYDKDAGKSVTGSARSAIVPFNSATTSGLAAIYGLTGKLPVIQDLAPSVGDRWHSRLQDALTIVQEENIMNQNPMNPERDLATAESIATRSLFFESLSSFIGPVVAFKTDDSRTRAMTQRLNTLQKLHGMSEGSVRYVKELDDSGIMFSSAAVSALRTSSVSNRFGFYSNIDTARGVQKNAKLLDYVGQRYEDNPLIGAMFNIVKPDSKYSAIADDILYSTTIAGKPAKVKNEPIQDTERRSEYNQAWASYFDNLDYIEAHAESRGIKKGTQAYQEQYQPWKESLQAYIGAQYPEWAARENNFSTNKSDIYVALAYHFIGDSNFMSTVGSQNGAIAGLVEYLKARETIMVELQANRERTGVQGVNTKANQRFQDWHDRMGELAIERYPEFKQMYNRYFADDKMNPYDPTLLGGGK